MLASRIDRLPPGEKDLLQTLAVIGKEFPLGLVREVSGKAGRRTAAAALGAADSRVHLRATSHFRRRVRLQACAIAGSRLRLGVAGTAQSSARTSCPLPRSAIPGNVETQPELIAHHYTEAGLGAQAIPYWQSAGERALQRSANLEAISHLKKGLDLLGSVPGAPERRSVREPSSALLAPVANWTSAMACGPIPSAA